MKNTAYARIAAVLAAATLTAAMSGCGIGPKPQAPVGSYDFGLAAANAPKLKLKSLSLVEVGAPRWLEGVNLYYRLGYSDIAQPRAYAQTRWIMPPANMVETRLKERAVAGGAVIGGGGPALKIELDEFSQVFDSATTSRAVLRARVTLVEVAPKTGVRQKAFAIEAPAPSADGPGGAAALKQAAETFVDAALAWAGE